MYQVLMDMGINEYAVKKAILDLSAVKDKFSQEDIAIVLRCERKVVNRACQKLLKAGAIKRIGSKRTGYRYLVIEEDHVY